MVLTDNASLIADVYFQKSGLFQRREEDPIEALGFLVRDSGLKIKYGVVSKTGIIFQSPDIPIYTGTDVDAGFTGLYETTDKLSFAALPDQVFFAQGGKVYNTLLKHDRTSIKGNTYKTNWDGNPNFAQYRQLESVSFSIDPPEVLPLPAASSDGGQTTEPPAALALPVAFTGITAIDVLKESANKFYLAVGEAADNSNTGKVVVFEGTDSAFAGIKQTFEVKGGAPEEWFGWSVKLHLLDKDGAGSGTPEPVLFVGAPKATIGSTSGVGYVKVFDISGSAIKTITRPFYDVDSQVRLFGYSIGARGEHLVVGMPGLEYSGSGTIGLISFWKWKISSINPSLSQYDRSQEFLAGGITYLGAQVGAFMHTTTPYFYATNATSSGGTTIKLYQPAGNGYEQIVLQETGVEYGSFFTIPVEKQDGSSTELLAFLHKDGGQLKIKYATLDVTLASGFLEYRGDIEIPGDVVDDFSLPPTYDTDPMPRRWSFAALPGRLFMGHGAELKSTLLTVDDTSWSITLGTETVAPAVTFTGITAIDVLKVADATAGDKFYLALGDSTDNSNTGKVVVFEGTDAEFATLTQTFEVLGDNAGDWFGWSVKLGILDRDGDTVTLSPEPVLFVGAPKAPGYGVHALNGVKVVNINDVIAEAGYVKLFDIEGTELQKLSGSERIVSPLVQGFGYSLDVTDPRIRSSYLIVGAPGSTFLNVEGGVVFVYKWKIDATTSSNSAYELRSVFSTQKKPSGTGLAGIPSRSELPSAQNNELYLGAEVGAFYMGDNKARFYAAAYDENRTRTTIVFFHAENSATDVREYSTGSKKHSISYASVEYGSFFIIPVTASNGDELDILGVLFRESSDGALKSKYATFRPPPLGVFGLTEFLTGEISLDMDTVTSVASGFTNLYTTTNKLSFAALEDKLFIVQGTKMYKASLTPTLANKADVSNLTFTVGDLAEESFGGVKMKVEMEFTQMTAFSILKVADDKFWVAVGDPADSSDTGKVVMFEGTDATLSDLEHKIEFDFTGGAAGDWFGWSVKLSLLDRDGAGTATPEPVLFIGVPGANGGKGLVITMALNPDTYRGSIPLPLGIPTFTYSDGDISVGAFGYSLQTITYNEDNFLIVGAPETQNGEGAVFFYKLDTTNGKFALRQAFFVGNKTGLTTGVSVKMKNVNYNKHFGASVGAFLYNNTPYFYAASHNDVDHTGTALHFFQRQDDSTISQFLQGDQPYGEVYDTAEYGAFFILPVQLWSLTYQNITEWYKTEAEAEEAKSGIGGTIASDSMDVFALLKLDGSLTIKPFSPEAGRQGFIALSGEEFDIGASLPTDLADGFTRLYSASKVSILSWENRLFVVQGTGIKTLAFSSTVLLNPFVTSLNIASRASQVETLTLTSADEQVAVISRKESSGFTKITAISVLKTTDKFYLALGDPADDTTIGKVAVFEGSDSAFSDIKHTFEVTR